jgi:hypothetical protein
LIYAFKVIRRRKSELPGFFADKELLHLYDIIASNYGKLPSEVAALSFEDLAICVACLRAKSERIDKIMKRTSRKKTAVFPTINLADLINCL